MWMVISVVLWPFSSILRLKAKKISTAERMARVEGKLRQEPGDQRWPGTERVSLEDLGPSE